MPALADLYAPVGVMPMEGASIAYFSRVRCDMSVVRCGFAVAVVAVFPVFELACTGGPQLHAEKDPNPPGSIAVGAGCLDDRDCLPGDFCGTVSHVCVKPSDPPGSVAVGQPCTYDSECGAGDVCGAAGVCVTDPYGSASQPAGVSCDWDHDCAGGFCDLDTHTCD
jgi:hypothetical protein